MTTKEGTMLITKSDWTTMGTIFTLTNALTVRTHKNVPETVTVCTGYENPVDLDRNQASTLAAVLQYFAEMGELPAPGKVQQ